MKQSETSDPGDADVEFTGTEKPPPEEISDWMRPLKVPAGLPLKLEAAKENFLLGKEDMIKKASGHAVLKLAGTELPANELIYQGLNLFRMLGGDAPAGPRAQYDISDFVNNVHLHVTIGLPPSVSRTVGKLSEERAWLNLPWKLLVLSRLRRRLPRLRRGPLRPRRRLHPPARGALHASGRHLCDRTRAVSAHIFASAESARRGDA